MQIIPIKGGEARASKNFKQDERKQKAKDAARHRRALETDYFEVKIYFFFKFIVSSV